MKIYILIFLLAVVVLPIISHVRQYKSLSKIDKAVDWTFFALSILALLFHILCW